MSYRQLRLILESHGITGHALNLVMNHLADRKQFVELNGVRSSHEGFKSYLPQGSCMTFLFLIYMNPLFKLKLHGKLDMYADDFALVTYKQFKSFWKKSI